MNFITRNWNSDSWTQKDYTQKDGDINITSGDAFDKAAVEYNCSVHGPSNELYPAKSDRKAVLTNLAYTALYFPMKGVTAAGNAIEGNLNLLKGGYQLVRNLSNKEFKKGEAFNPFFVNVKQFFKDGIVAFTGYSAYTGVLDFYYGSYTPEYWGYNLAQVAAIGILGFAALRAIHNPQGFQRTIHNRYISWLDAKPMTDAEVHNASLLQKAVAVLDGRYSLARLLNMHYMGRADQGKFEELKKS